MSLDLRYVLAPSLQEYFVDKTTGLPLSGGIVTFYSDNNRTVLKNVYEITGSPPDYTFTALPNPVILSAVGTIQDNAGNDVLPYYYPFDNNGNVELYYITVQSSTDVPQFTREAFPSGIEGAPTPPTPSQVDLVNYVPNSQFLVHYNIPGDDLSSPIIQPGQITGPVTQLAPGGWVFERPNSSTALDLVTFHRFDAYITPPPPSASPRYAVEVINNGVSISDTFKDLSVRFIDVNKFASPTNSSDPLYQPYTFSFVAQSQGGTFPVSLYIKKYFGSGTSSGEVDTFLTTFSITNIETIYSFAFAFGTNESYVIGPNDDDYVEVAIRFPSNQTFDVQITDVILTPGNVTITSFPTTTNADMLARSLTFVYTPKADGSDLYLPLQLTRSGMAPDYATIGYIYPASYVGSKPGYLPGDGTRYEVSGYSDDGIPYRRFYNQTFEPHTGLQPWGNGADFAQMQNYGGSQLNILLVTNQAGGQTDTADGVTATGFTFNTLITGDTTLGFNAYTFYDPVVAQYSIWCISKDVGIAVDKVTDGNTGFMVVAHASDTQSREGNDFVTQIAIIQMPALPPQSSYFWMATHAVQYYIWYNIDGGGVDPMPSNPDSAIGIEVGIYSTMTTADVGVATVAALNSAQVTSIVITKNGSTLTPNSYFTFDANSQLYVVWYSLNGAGTQPSVAGAIYIPITYTTGDSNTQIGQKTLFGFNGTYMSTPDLRGYFLRGVNDGVSPAIDPNAITRYSNNLSYFGDKVGTLQFDLFAAHFHESLQYSTGSVTKRQWTHVNIDQAGSLVDTSETNLAGGAQTNPKNFSVNWVIKI